MLTRKQKEEIVEVLADKFKRKKIALFSDFHGISAAKLLGLRRMLKKSGAEYKVAKKTLLDLALDRAGSEFKTRHLQGEIGIAFGYGEETSPAKTLAKFSKENETFKILGGILDSRILSGEEAVALAKLPSQEMLRAQVLGTLQSPIRGLTLVLQGNIRNLVVILNKIKVEKS